jgi:hypothetical protein
MYSSVMKLFLINPFHTYKHFSYIQTLFIHTNSFHTYKLCSVKLYYDKLCSLECGTSKVFTDKLYFPHSKHVLAKHLLTKKARLTI